MSINLKNFGNNPVEFYPEQISSLILKKIVKDSEFYLSKKLKKKIKIKKAVITVPAYFNQKQREATYQAAEIAGLEVKRMINEPTAASLAYEYKTLEDNINKQILVLDFGGGTLDLTLLQLSKKKENEIYFDIKFSYGNTNFGGDDFDYIIMEKCLEKVKEKNLDIKLKNNIRLKRMCERAKIKLSTCDSTQIILEEYAPNIPIYFSLSKNDFHKYCQPLFQKFEDILKKFLIESKRSEKDISEVILIGGSNLIPKIQSIIKNIFKYSSIKIDLDPKEVVAKGAAIQAAMLSDLSPVNKMYLLDVTNLSLGINVLGNKMSKIIKRSTPLPEESSDTFITTEDNQTSAIIKVYEGEDNENKNNLFLDEFIIYNLPKMKKGEAKIKVNFYIDLDSILKVTAFDQQNENNKKELEIRRPKGLRDIIKDLEKKNNEININLPR